MIKKIAIDTLTGAITLCIIIPQIVVAFDNPHFYRAPFLFSEPRFERKLLSTFDITFGAGSTKKSLDSCKKEVALFDLYGTHNMHELGENVPGKDLTDPRDITLTNLSLLPARDCFATFSIGGKFKTRELVFSYIQNAAKGFFAQLHLPVRKLEITNTCFTDLSPRDNICPNINTPEWQAFLNQFDSILCKYGLRRDPFEKTGVGDTTLYAGWTTNYQDTEILDYIDVTLRLGVLLPTAQKKNEDQIFSLPLGYNGHIGVPLNGALAIGLYEWLTLGSYVNAIWFANKTRDVRVRTAAQQSGIIKLAKFKTKIDKGTLFHGGVYVKADHFVRGFSFLLGYSFANQNSDQLTICDSCGPKSCIVNADPAFAGFKMHTIHLWCEYDFTREDARFGPRLSFFYNREVSGKRIFRTSILGGGFGLDIAWDI